MYYQNFTLYLHQTNKDMKVLFESEFCKIIDVDGIWIRVDKILKTVMVVKSYFDQSGKLIKQQ